MECQAWFSTNATIPTVPQPPDNSDSHVLCLKNICLVDGSCTFTSQFNDCGWVWKDMSGQTQLMCTRNSKRQESALHSEVKPLTWAIESMLCH